MIMDPIFSLAGSDVVLDTKVLVLNRLEDEKQSLGLGLGLEKKSWEFSRLFHALHIGTSWTCIQPRRPVHQASQSTNVRLAAVWSDAGKMQLELEHHDISSQPTHTYIAIFKLICPGDISKTIH